MVPHWDALRWVKTLAVRIERDAQQAMAAAQKRGVAAWLAAYLRQKAYHCDRDRRLQAAATADDWACAAARHSFERGKCEDWTYRNLLAAACHS